MATSRATTVVILAALVTAGTGIAVYFREQSESDSSTTDASTIRDAATDVRTDAAKAKPVANKKKTVRGGKTKVVAGHAASPGGGDHGGHHATAASPTGAHSGHAAHGGHASPHGPSYESVLDSNNQQINMGASTGPDLTDAQLSHPMADGSFVSECGAPDDMAVTVKVAIQKGHAVGVSVVTSPPSAEVSHCIDRHVRALSWPSSPKMDSFVTTY